MNSSAGGRMYIMAHAMYQVPCCGVIKQWSFAAHRSTLIDPIQFSVWRPVDRNTTVRAYERFQEKKVIYRLLGLTDYFYIGKKCLKISTSM